MKESTPPVASDPGGPNTVMKDKSSARKPMEPFLVATRDDKGSWADNRKGRPEGFVYHMRPQAHSDEKASGKGTLSTQPQ